MNKAERAIEALLEAATAYRELPDVFKSRSMLGGGPAINVQQLEQEASRIKQRIDALKEAMEEM